MLDQKFANNLKNYVNQTGNKKLILTISGGPDSVCLLDIFSKFRKNFQLELHVAHFNHLIRRQESDIDAGFVKELSQKYDVPFYTERFDTLSFAKNNNLSLEEAARIKRYEYFAGLAEKIGSKTIVTGHHADDQVETVLLRILQGTGVDSLGGMSTVSPLFCNPSLSLFRPLINIWRWELQKYIESNKLPYREDRTNQENKYFRNRIRNKLIPLLCNQFTPALKDNIFQLSQILQEDTAYFQDEMNKIKVPVTKDNNNLLINISDLPSHPSLRKRLLLKIFKGSHLPPETFTFHNLNTLDSLLEQNKTSFTLNLKNNYILQKNQNLMTIKKEVESDHGFSITADSQGKYQIDKIHKSFNIKVYEKPANFVIPKLNNPGYFDADKVKFPIKIRSRKSGDTFHPFGQSGTKKIKDYLIDKKISRFQRWKIPIICDANNEVIWVGHYQIDDRFKITDNTRNILEISIEKKA